MPESRNDEEYLLQSPANVERLQSAVQAVYISTNNPHRCGGKPTIKDTRINVELIQSLKQQGYAPRDIQDMYPHLSIAQIQAAIDYPLTAQDRFPQLPAEIADAYWRWLQGADETCPDSLDTEDVFAAGFTAGKEDLLRAVKNDPS